MAKKETAFGSGPGYQHYKALGKKVANSIDRKALGDYVKLMLSEKPIDQQRAAAVCQNVSDLRPEMFLHHLPALVRAIDRPAHSAVYRTVFRLLSMLDLPESHSGKIVDLAFHNLSDPKQPTGIKVFAMTVISNQALQYPELARELSLVLEGQYKSGSAGFRNRAEKIAKKHGFSLQA